MSYATIEGHLNDLERKIAKGNAIAQKGNDIGLRDAMRLGAKSSAIAATLKKQITAYKVYIKRHTCTLCARALIIGTDLPAKRRGEQGDPKENDQDSRAHRGTTSSLGVK